MKIKKSIAGQYFNRRSINQKINQYINWSEINKRSIRQEINIRRSINQYLINIRSKWSKPNQQQHQYSPSNSFSILILHNLVLLPHFLQSWLTCSCASTWYANSSCLRSSPHLMITERSFQLCRCPYGDASRIRRTFSTQGSLRAAAEGSSGSRCKTRKKTDTETKY